MKHDSQHIDLLIARFLSGEATATEVRELEQWMNIAASNKKYFEQSKYVHEQAKAFYPYKNYDAEKAWQSIHGKMKATPENGTKTRELKSAKNYWLRIAAGILIIVGISTLFYITRKPSAPEMLTLKSAEVSMSNTLADNSEIVLNKNTTITYSKDFGKKNRKLKLTGEAYFKVEHKDDLPFIVEAGGVFIKDIGTTFNIKAYPKSENVEIFVESGVVEFYSTNNPGLVLSEGESAVYNKADSTFTLIQKSAENLLAYKTRIFRFNNTQLIDVVTQLNSVYNSEIRILNQNISSCRITVNFEDENIENIVQVISETLGLQVVVDDHGFALKGNTCMNE